MTWFKVDDGLWHHPKAMTLRNGPIGLWVRAGAWSAHHLTDGHVSLRMLSLFIPERTRDIRHQADELVEAGLWLPTDTEGEWQFHDWLKYQPSKEDVMRRRNDSADRQRRAREQRHLRVIKEKNQ